MANVVACSIASKRARFALDNNNDHNESYYVRMDGKSYPVEVWVKAQDGAVTPNPLPSLYDQHPNDLNSYVLEIAPQQQARGDFVNWVVAVRYGKLPAGKSPADNVPNPIDRSVKYRLDAVYRSKEIFQDVNNHPILTVNGETIARPAVVDEAFPSLTCQRNVASLTEILNFQVNYQNAYNSNSPFFTFAAGQVKCESITSSDIQHENGISFYTMFVRFGFYPENASTSHLQVPQFGFEENDGLAVDGLGNNRGSPVLLSTSSGVEAVPGDSDTTVDVLLRTQNMLDLGMGG